MDKKNVFWMIGIFLIGAIIGGVIVCLVCCNCNDSCSHSCKNKDNGRTTGKPVGFVKISVDTANKYFNCYMKYPRSIDTLVAFSVSREQLDVMTLLSDNDTAVKSFRIYMGIFGDPIPVDMVVGVDAEGDDITDNIYKTEPSDPCPILCDESSDIVTPDK